MMISIYLEHRFLRTPDGRVWTQVALPYSAWQTYLNVFDSVNVVARIEDVTNIDDNMKLSSGHRVSFTTIPYFVGPRQFLLKSGKIKQAVRKSLDGHSAVLLRIPGTLGMMAYEALKTSGQPYAAQIVGDPYEVFAPGAVRHPLRPLFRRWFTYQMKIQALHASVISYVTRAALQRRYPSRAAFSNSFSDVELPIQAFAVQPRIDWKGLFTEQRPCRLVLVGSLEQLYKSPDITLRAMANCIQQGLHLQLTIIGDGKHRAELENLSHELNLEDKVTFAGHLSAGDAVRVELDKADIFVLPSRTEGLPRAMIEAMARAMPCIGSTVGGIPELLDEEDLVPPGDVLALVEKIQNVVLSPDRLESMSRRNLEVAHSYADDVLNQQRQDFYESLLLATARWQADRNPKKLKDQAQV